MANSCSTEQEYYDNFIQDFSTGGWFQLAEPGTTYNTAEYNFVHRKSFKYCRIICSVDYIVHVWHQPL